MVAYAMEPEFKSSKYVTTSLSAVTSMGHSVDKTFHSTNANSNMAAANLARMNQHSDGGEYNFHFVLDSSSQSTKPKAKHWTELAYCSKNHKYSHTDNFMWLPHAFGIPIH
jgi:hypothetical protein